MAGTKKMGAKKATGAKAAPAVADADAGASAAAAAAAAAAEKKAARKAKKAAIWQASTAESIVEAPKPEKSSAFWGVGASTGGDDEELNPGLLLTDLVNADRDIDAAVVDQRMSKLAGKGKKKASKKAAPEPAAEAEDALDFGDITGDEAEAGSGDKLVKAMSKLRREDVEDSVDLSEQRRLIQARPESEFHAGAAGEEVTVDDLLAPLADAPNLGDVRRQLEGLQRAEKMPEPAPEPKRNREERNAQYQNTKKDQMKWLPQMHRMEKAEQVELVELDNEDKPKTTASLVGTFQPVDDFEKELAEITQAAGAGEDAVKGSKVLPVNSRIRDEKQTQQLARLKALMLREQQTAKRMNKIKSKTYRRIHRRSETREREALVARLETENPEMAKQLKEEYEKKRAQMRLQRQRNARQKWTAAMQRFAKGDKGAQREISKQAQAAHDERMSLRRAIAGKDANASDESDAVDLSDSENDGEATGGKRRTEAQKTIDRAKKLTVEEIKDLEHGGELPTTGILGMNFMRDAIKRKREDAKQQAKTVLEELEGMGKEYDSEASDDEAPARKKTAKAGEVASEKDAEAKTRKFTTEELEAARKQLDDMPEHADEPVECSVSGPLTIKSMEAQSVPAAAGARAKAKKGKKGKKGGEAADQAGGGAAPAAAAAAKAAQPAEENPWETAVENPWEEAPSAEPTADATAKADEDEEEEEEAKTVKGAKSAKGRKSEDVLSALNADSAEALEQRDLVRTAFVEGTQMEDFDDQEEEKRRKKDEEHDAKNEGLAGWGSWTGACLQPRKPKGAGKGRDAKKKAEEKSAKPSRVTFTEKSTETAKYFVDKVPFPFKNPAQYDAAMQMPSGPEWNTMSTHMNKIKPKYFMKVGAIVPPLAHVKHLEPEKREDVINTWAASKQPKRLKAKV